MTSLNPLSAIHVRGDAVIRGVTIALPSKLVLNFLPAGLELGEQNITGPGNHPVLFLFSDMLDVEASIPSPIAPIDYHEHRVCIPFAFISKSALTPGPPGPYCYMPKLYVDSFLAMFGGLVFQGALKEMAHFKVTPYSFSLADAAARQLTSIEWTAGKDGTFRPAADFQLFKGVRQMLSQPLVSGGPVFVLYDFEKSWDFALLRPLHTKLSTQMDYVQGYAAEPVPSDGIDASQLGSYELRTSWRLSSPLPPLLFNLQRSFFSQPWYS